MPNFIECRAALIVIDMQQGDGSAIPTMAGFEDRVARTVPLVAAARPANTPVIFFQEMHRRDMVDFGRELDGTEDVHCLEGDPGTSLTPELQPQPGDYHIVKRRYSCFFGTELLILLRGLKAETLVLCGELTDVCVHYTFVDAHQHDYYTRVVEDCCGGSSLARHEAALDAMEYLQTGARCSSEQVIAAFQALAQAA